jgi:exosortase A-associated hydrolase 2
LTRSRLEPFFLESSAGRLFLLLRAPARAERCVLFIPPFGEEMNKCRRQFTETAQILVEHGYAVLLVDLFGTGDSDGEFADATWSRWKANVAAAMEWIADHALRLDAVVAVRLGCALAAESLHDANRRVARTVFWQPVDSGRDFMTRFLRLRIAASMMADGRKETVEGLKTRLEGGDRLEVAGYSLSPELWREIEAVNLSVSLHSCLGNIAIFEVGKVRDDEVSPNGKHLVSAAEGRGIVTTALRIPGEPFWATTEVAINSELARHTASYLAGGPLG